MEVEVQDPITGEQGTLNASVQRTSNGNGDGGDGKGRVIEGTLTHAATEEEVEGLMHTNFDRAVTIQGYPDTMFNQMFRTIGSREVHSTAYKKWAVDQRKQSTVTTSAVTITASNVQGTKVFKSAAITTIPVADASAAHVKDQVTFKGIAGYTNDGLPHKGYYLNGYVCNVVNKSNEQALEVVFINLNPAQSLNISTVTIAASTEVLILGAALAEEDAQVTPTETLPEPNIQYMQKFMTQANVTNVWLEADKEVDWGLGDIKEGVSREFLLETEKTYLFGKRAYFKDPLSGRMIRTTAGFFEQLFEEGVEVLEVWKDDLTDESVIDTMKTVFVGNRGSERRYMATGMDFAAALFSLKSMQKQVAVNASRREYSYDWQIWKLFNYTIQNKPYALFDMLGFGNWAFVFDKANIERCVFRAMDEDMLDLNKLAIEDSKIMRCSEISSMSIRYAKCHRLIIMHDGSQATNPNGANDKTRMAA